MAVDVSGRRMRQAGINRDVAAQRFEHIKHFGKFKVLFAAPGKPAPIRPRGIGLERQADTVRMVDTDKSLRRLVLAQAACRKRFEPRQSERHAGAAKKRPAAQRDGFITHRMFHAYLELKMLLLRIRFISSPRPSPRRRNCAVKLSMSARSAKVSGLPSA